MCSIHIPIIFQRIFECRYLARGTNCSYSFFLLEKISSFYYELLFLLMRSWLMSKGNTMFLYWKLGLVPSFFCFLKLCWWVKYSYFYPVCCSLLVTNPVFACLLELEGFCSTTSMISHFWHESVGWYNLLIISAHMPFVCHFDGLNIIAYFFHSYVQLHWEPRLPIKLSFSVV